MTKVRWVLFFAACFPSCRIVLDMEEAQSIPDDDSELGGAGAMDPGGPSTGGTVTTPGDGDGDGDDDDDDDEPKEPKTPCEIYCDDMGKYCTDEDRQFVADDQCLAACQLYEEGAVGEDGNTQSCRVKYAGKGRYTAGVERSVSCRQAGPAGYGVCGSVCEGYCTAVMAACTPEVTSLYYYESLEDCMSECAGLPAPDEVLYSVSNGEVFDGGHVQCRLFHALSALMMDAEEHCEHALGVTLCELNE